MKKMTKRLVALLMTLILALSGLVALAEQPAAIGPEAVYARGNSVKTEIAVKVDVETVKGLIAMMNGTSEQDESSQLAMQSLLGALNKLKTTIISSKDTANYTVGTEQGSILDGEAMLDTVNSDAYLTISLLPGIKLSYPKEMIEVFTKAQQQAADIQKMTELAVPYGDAMLKVVNEEILAKAKVSEEAYSIEGVGEFTKRYELEVNGTALLAFMKAYNDVFRNDKEMQAMFDSMVKSLSELENSSTDTAPTAADLIKQIDEAVAQGEQSEPEKAIFGQFTLYEDAEKNSYFEFAGQDLDTAAPQYFVSGHIVGDEKDVDMDLAVIVKGERATAPLPEMLNAEVTPEPAKPEPADWDAIKAGIMDGSDMTGMLILVKLQAKEDQAANSATGHVTVNLQGMGMRMGVSSDSQTTLTGDYKASGKAALSFMTDSPLLTMEMTSEEITEAPVLKPADGLKAVTIQEEMSAEDQELLGNAAVGEGLPQLIEKLKVALPEEGPILAAMLESAINQGTSTPN